MYYYTLYRTALYGTLPMMPYNFCSKKVTLNVLLAELISDQICIINSNNCSDKCIAFLQVVIYIAEGVTQLCTLQTITLCQLQAAFLVRRFSLEWCPFELVSPIGLDHILKLFSVHPYNIYILTVFSCKGKLLLLQGITKLGINLAIKP